jgi:hypothetical protein
MSTDASCFYCGAPIGDEWTALGLPPLERDHFQPSSRGGANTEDNLVPSCRTCNRKKWAKEPDEWARVCIAEAFESIHRLRWLIGEVGVNRLSGLLSEYERHMSLMRGELPGGGAGLERVSVG